MGDDISPVLYLRNITYQFITQFKTIEGLIETAQERDTSTNEMNN